MRDRGLIMAFALALAMTCNAQQWLRFVVKPANAILTVDDQRLTLRDGIVELMVQPGMHKYVAQSPFFETMTDTFEVKEETRRDLLIVMQAAYAYIEVRSGKQDGKIFVDQKQIGIGEKVSNRLTSGHHRLTVLSDSMCLCDAKVTLLRAEKKLLDIPSMGLQPFPWDPARWLIPLDALAADGSVDSLALQEAHAEMALDNCGVNVMSNIQGATILIDGKPYGNTPLVITGLIAGRTYLLTLRQPGCKDAHATFNAQSGEILDLYLKLKP